MSWLLAVAACGPTPAAVVANQGSAKPAPRARPCDLDVDLVALDDLAWEATRRDQTTLGSCRITVAPRYERFQLHAGAQLVAELIYTCGVVAYAPGLGHDGARVGMTGRDVLARFADPVVSCSGSIMLPDDQGLATCEIDGIRYIIEAPAPDATILGTAARSFFADKTIAGIELYRSRRCG